MQRFICEHCRRWASLAQMRDWVQEWCAGQVRHLCPRCRGCTPVASAAAVRREFFVDQNYLVRTRALRPHHHVVPPTAS